MASLCSRSRSPRRVFALAATVLHDSAALLAAGVAAIALVSALAASAVRRDAGRAQASEEWQRKLRGELMAQTAFLDDVVGSLAAMTSSRDAAPRPRTPRPSRPTGSCTPMPP